MKKYSNKKKHKKALILPLTLSFMLISQLSYWGLLHLQKNQLQRLQQMTAYYQAEIQQILVKDQLDLTRPQELSNNFSRHIYQQLIDFQEHNLDIQNFMIKSSSDKELVLPQYGWLDISLNEEEERILVYKIKVYLDKNLFKFLKNHPDLYFSGLLSSKLFPQDFLFLEQVNPNPFPFMLDELLDIFFQADYELVKNTTHRKLYNWSFDAYQDIAVEFIFNTGKTTLYQTNSQYIMDSEIEMNTLNRSISYPLPQGQYLLQWEGYILKR